MFFVLSGRPMYRSQEGEEKLAPGNFVFCPEGRAGLHALSNPGDEPAEILAISAGGFPDVVAYPEHGYAWVATGIRIPSCSQRAATRASSRASRSRSSRRASRNCQERPGGGLSRVKHVPRSEACFPGVAASQSTSRADPPRLRADSRRERAPPKTRISRPSGPRPRSPATSSGGTRTTSHSSTSTTSSSSFIRPLPRTTTFLLLLLVRVAVREAIVGRDALIAQAAVLELERRARVAELEVR
jgi:Cupin domain